LTGRTVTCRELSSVPNFSPHRIMDVTHSARGRERPVSPTRCWRSGLETGSRYLMAAARDARPCAAFSMSCTFSGAKIAGRTCASVLSGELVQGPPNTYPALPANFSALSCTSEVWSPSGHGGALIAENRAEELLQVRRRQLLRRPANSEGVHRLHRCISRSLELAHGSVEGLRSGQRKVSNGFVCAQLSRMPNATKHRSASWYPLA
jgi:hypothetical protein